MSESISTREENFTAYLMERIRADNGFAAALKRADNPDTEYQAWEHLSRWCDLSKDHERIIFCTISAAIARAKPEHDGVNGLGQAIKNCYDKDNLDAGKIKLRRVLACSSREEICGVLRSILRLIESRGVKLSYSRLLNDLLYFGTSVKSKWATEFYGTWREE